MKTFKKVILIIVILALSSFMLFSAGKKYFIEASVDLKKVHKVTAHITSSYQTKRSIGGRGRKVGAFVFTISKYNYRFGASPSPRYLEKVVNNLQTGDTVTVYYDPEYEGQINYNIYQIEKSGRVIFAYNTYKSNNILTAILLVLGACFLLALIVGVVKS
ncbi:MULTISPECIES: DUF3592 domain-containing protein [Niastella]|uniref:DUF3592 domain-containing protein n=1 Tax=Niastella soli TaxID=2821487 RepID=A0ABS3YZ35_9BACT|nr:DUF3592 domain-containing protein [Niastella soli]MBO9203194.1 DUF3592 domain-containing protein [Niastella soli]